MATPRYFPERYPREYASWSGMRSRCSNPNDPGYRYYGGRGITVCRRWRSFENFIADMGARPPNTSIDRINPNGHYEPGNCQWGTSEDQGKNKRKRYKTKYQVPTLACDPPDNPWLPGLEPE